MERLVSKSEQSRLDRAVVEALDPSRQFEAICALGEHLRDGLRRADAADLKPVSNCSAFVVAGMGGSAIGARLAQAVLEPRVPMVIAQGYELPAWINPTTVVLCSSYSGNTEETLSCYRLARAAGAHVICATTGGELGRLARADGVPMVELAAGYQPRATVGYGVAVTLAVAAHCRAGEFDRDDLAGAAELVDGLVEEWGPGGPTDAEAKVLARALFGTVAVVCGADLTASVAYRWKCQFNENAKLPAFYSELPELNHNEILAWQSASELNLPLAAVFLVDPEAHDRIQKRYHLTAKLIRADTRVLVTAEARGKTRMERMFSLVLLGDLISLYLAILHGKDPETITLLERFKTELSH